MITPTIGRIVWVRGRHAQSGKDGQAEMGTIAYVNEDGTINIGGFTHGGMPYANHHV
jgi:hypothetical protein